MIHIIAGPPGIGKSTIGHQFVPPGMEILKKDELIATNKAFHDKLFAEIAIQKWLSTIKHNLANDLDFAFELNMGMPKHYDFVLPAKNDPQNKLNVILFFTDDLAMCQDRAAKRFEQGEHYVNPVVLENMYHNTIPLLAANFESIDHLTLVDVKRNAHPLIAGVYDKADLSFDIYSRDARWFWHKIKPFIEDQVNMPTYFFSR
jgi:predicted ABC-type ATPase